MPVPHRSSIFNHGQTGTHAATSIYKSAQRRYPRTMPTVTPPPSCSRPASPSASMQRSHAQRVSLITSASPKSAATRSSSVATSGCGVPTDGASCHMCGGGRCRTCGCRSICSETAQPRFLRSTKGVRILPRASHAGRPPSVLQIVRERGRSAVVQRRCSYMRGTQGGTSQWPLQPL